MRAADADGSPADDQNVSLFFHGHQSLTDIKGFAPG
jgi:hypothetical protein